MTSTIKVNNIQNQCGANIINENSNTITIGASGDTIALASGASQTGFGREGSVDWQTGSIKTTTFTATSGEGYFVDTSSGAVTANLPAGVAGAIVAFADYTRSFATNKLTITPNGSNKIGGFAQSAELTVNGQSATFVFVDATEGWINVQETQTSQTGVPPFIQATGGTITEDGDFRIHTFTGPGTFQVNSIATQSPAPIYNIVSYVVAAGGGGGGGTAQTTHVGAGGGAGGFREGKNAPVDSYTASPLNAPAGLPVSATSYPIQVGGGGPASPSAPQRGTSGTPSIFSTITSAGGGGGGALGSGPAPSCRSGGDGGSGGGGSSQVAGAGGSGDSPPTTPAQGFPGAQGVDAPPDLRGGGGGGATAAGTQGSPPGTTGRGGAGATTNITGSPVGYSGGGGGGATSGAGPGTSQTSPCGS